MSWSLRWLLLLLHRLLRSHLLQQLLPLQLLIVRLIRLDLCLSHLERDALAHGDRCTRAGPGRTCGPRGRGRQCRRMMPLLLLLHQLLVPELLLQLVLLLLLLLLLLLDQLRVRGSGGKRGLGAAVAGGWQGSRQLSCGGGLHWLVWPRRKRRPAADMDCLRGPAKHSPSACWLRRFCTV